MRAYLNDGLPALKIINGENIGILLDANSFGFKGLAPIYDNGQSFFFQSGPAMYDSWDAQLAALKSLRPMPWILPSISFRNDITSEY